MADREAALGRRHDRGHRNRHEARRRRAGAGAHHRRQRRDRCAWPARCNAWSASRAAVPASAAARARTRRRPPPAAATRGRRALFPRPAPRACSARPRPITACCRPPRPCWRCCARAGYQPVVPDKLDGQCCGQPFQSKGFPGGGRESSGRRLACRARRGAWPGVVASVTDMLDLRQAPAEHDGEDDADSAEFLHRRGAAAADHHPADRRRRRASQLLGPAPEGAGGIEALARACARRGRGALLRHLLRLCRRQGAVPARTQRPCAPLREQRHPRGVAGSASRPSRPAPSGSPSGSAFPSCRWRACSNMSAGRKADSCGMHWQNWNQMPNAARADAPKRSFSVTKLAV